MILEKGGSMHLAKVTLYVESQEEAKLFWLEKMGFEITLEQPMGPGMTWLEVGNKDLGASLVLYPREMMESQDSSVSTACPSLLFSTGDIQSKYDSLKSNGVKLDELQIMPYGKMTTFYDQDGNRFILRED